MRKRPDFQEGLARLADLHRDRHPGSNTGNHVSRRADGYLKEMAAAHSPAAVNLAAYVTRLLYRRGYGEIRYDPEHLEELKRLAADHPVVFLPSHKSNLDHLVLRRVLWENGHRNHHTAGGINMSFFPVGPIARRAGLFFIRRTFGDDPVYKFVLRSYFEYLIERGSSLEWYMEGTRSRTGKLLPPRYGLLGYAADAMQTSGRRDIYLIPTSISYDHVHEVDDYSAEQAGRAKQPETFTWLMGTVRALRRSNGNIHLRFGEPLPLRDALASGASDSPDAAEAERRPALQEAAFEVCARINLITPITPSALATVPLSAAGGRSLTRPELAAALAELIAYIRARRLPTTEPLAVLENPEGLDRVIKGLVEHEIVTVDTAARGSGVGGSGARDSGVGREGGGAPPSYRIPPDRRLAAGYYRNTIIHFFITPAVAEMCLAAAAAAPHSPSDAFRSQASGLRDLLGIEFFFPRRRAFLDEIRREMDRRDPAWEDLLEKGGAARLLERRHPHRAPWVLRPFLEAYLVAAEELEESARPPAGETRPQQEQVFLEACLERGARYLAEGRIAAAEAVSQNLFANALRQSEATGEGGAAPDRAAFAEAVRRALAVLDAIPGPLFPDPSDPGGAAASAAP